jgi:hypothetical protein
MWGRRFWRGGERRVWESQGIFNTYEFIKFKGLLREEGKGKRKTSVKELKRGPKTFEVGRFLMIRF